VALRAVTATDHGPVSNWTPIRWACGSSGALLQPRAQESRSTCWPWPPSRGAGAGPGGPGGSLQPGRRADLVRLRGDRPGLANVHDPRQQVVYCASPADVADVWVDGVRRVAEGRLVGHDLAALVEASHPLAAELVTRADLGKFSRLATGLGC
jgi:hypothetical protein